MKNFPLRVSMPNQRTANTRRKCPLENNSTLPVAPRMRLTIRSARSVKGKSVSPVCCPVRLHAVSPCLAMQTVGSVSSIESVSIIGQVLQPVSCGSEQGSICSDSVNGNTFQQFRKAAFIGEGSHECGLVERTQRMHDDTAGQVDPSRSQDFQRKIACFAGENCDEHFDCRPA